MSDLPTPAGRGQWKLVTKPTDLGMPSAGIGHEQEKPGAEQDSIRAGHEPDWFDARGVIFVPILVLIAAAATYGFVTLMFNYFDPGTPLKEGAHPVAAAQNARHFNERVVDISSQDPDAPVRQPRLEWMRTVEKMYEGEPTFYRSMRALEFGNPPEIRPEDLRPENFVDWNTGERPLAEFGWVDREKGVARIPVNEAIRILATEKKLPAQTGTPLSGTVGLPRMSNGGQVGLPRSHRSGEVVPTTQNQEKEQPKDAESKPEEKPEESKPTGPDGNDKKDEKP
jgi:hypothetical protein